MAPLINIIAEFAPPFIALENTASDSLARRTYFTKGHEENLRDIVRTAAFLENCNEMGK